MKMKKGITPVVAVIMLLLIVISLVGGMFVWMRRTMGGVQKEVANQTMAKTKTMGQTISVDSCSCTADAVYASAGSVAIDKATLYVNGTLCNSSSIGAKEVVTFNATSGGCGGLDSGDPVKMVVAGAPGNFDEAVACGC